MTETDPATRLSTFGPFDQLPRGVIADLRDHLSTRTLAQGESLFTDRAGAGALAVVTEGCVNIELATDGLSVQLAQVEAGEVVGEIAALLGGQRSADVTAAGPCELIVLSSAGVELLNERAPNVVEHLVETATRRLRETQLAALLARRFGTEPGTGRHPLADAVEWVSLESGQRLFDRGDEADAAYILVSGRLRILGDEQAGEAPGHWARELVPGDLVGEMTLLRAAPRAFGVAATRDSTLARLPGNVFDRLAMDHPHSALGVVRSFLDGLQGPAGRAERAGMTITVVSGDPAVDLAGWAARFAERLGRLGDTAHFSAGSVDESLGKDGIANSPAGTAEALRVGYWLDDAEQAHQVVVLEADPENTAWTRRALGQADRVLILADATAALAPPGPLERAVYDTFRDSLAPPAMTLVLLHPEDTGLPRDTARRLSDRPVAGHLNIRRNSDAHLDRLARIASGRAIGLVLGGGGARGFAHLGVIRAMRELHIPVDMVAASSIGAPLAVAVALEFSDDELLPRSASFFAGLKDYTIPVVAILKGRAVTRQIATATEGRDFEDCWIPFFCVSTSIARSEEVVHQRGPLTPAIRASVSIPGVLPPVAFDGDVLIDGATVNHLPMDRMRQANPTGTVIAVDVSHSPASSPKGSFPPHISGWSALFAWLRKRSGDALPPRIGATLMAASLVGSNRDKHRQLDRGLADLYLPLDVAGLNLLDFSPENARRGAAVGYEASFALLREWRDQHLPD